MVLILRGETVRVVVELTAPLNLSSSHIVTDLASFIPQIWMEKSGGYFSWNWGSFMQASPFPGNTGWRSDTDKKIKPFTGL